MQILNSVRKGLFSIPSYVPGKPIEELEREYGIKHAIKLASNENAFGPSPKAIAALKACANRVHRYPDGGCFYLATKLAKKLKVLSQNLIFGNGSDELLVLAVRAFVNKNEEIIIADPTFLIYEIAGRVQGARVMKVPVKNFHYDLEGMLKKINSKKATLKGNLKFQKGHSALNEILKVLL